MKDAREDQTWKEPQAEGWGPRGPHRPHQASDCRPGLQLQSPGFLSCFRFPGLTHRVTAHVPELSLRERAGGGGVGAGSLAQEGLGAAAE